MTMLSCLLLHLNHVGIEAVKKSNRLLLCQWMGLANTMASSIWRGKSKLYYRQNILATANIFNLLNTDLSMQLFSHGFKQASCSMVTILL